MTRLAPSAYLDHIRRDSARFRDVLAACDPDTRVPTCPEWSAADLLWHLTTVQHSWWAVVANRPRSPGAMGYEEPARPEGHAALLAAFDEAHAAFAAALEGAGPAEPAWSWSDAPGDQTVGFTYRRQAHETLIHRVDAELAAGTPTALDPALAADGVDEALDKMYGALPPWGRFEPGPRFVEFRISDAGTSVWTQLGTFAGTAPDGEVLADEQDMHVVTEPGVPPAAVVAGDAADLDVWLWHRGAEDAVTLTGDRDALDHVRAVLGNPIT